MKNFKSAMLNLLLTRLAILLEFEPGDAVQAGYFRHLRELRNRLADSQRETAPVVAGRVRTAEAAEQYRKSRDSFFSCLSGDEKRAALSMIERLSVHCKKTKKPSRLRDGRCTVIRRGFRRWTR